MKTWNAKPDEIKKKWWLVDAQDQSVGRVATQIAQVLRGKHQPTFTPHVDTGDFVVVINADKVQLSGRKWEQKKYYRRSRFFGSLKETQASEMKEKKPEVIIQEAVAGMLPKTKLGHKMIKKLKAYSGAEHPHWAQRPEAMNIK